MLIDPLPIKLEQELKYEIAYAVSCPGPGPPQPAACRRASANAPMLVMPGNAAFCAEMFSGSRE